MKADFNELLGAVDLGAEVGLRAGADVALDAGNVRVRRDFIRRVLRRHHVAGAAAKLRRIHIRCAVIAGGGDDEQIDDRCDEDDVEAVAEDAIVEIDAGKLGGNLAGFEQLAAAHPDADGNERKAEDERAPAGERRR